MLRYLSGKCNKIRHVLSSCYMNYECYIAARFISVLLLFNILYEVYSGTIDYVVLMRVFKAQWLNEMKD